MQQPTPELNNKNVLSDGEPQLGLYCPSTKKFYSLSPGLLRQLQAAANSPEIQ